MIFTRANVFSEGESEIFCAWKFCNICNNICSPNLEGFQQPQQAQVPQTALTPQQVPQSQQQQQHKFHPNSHRFHDTKYLKANHHSSNKEHNVSKKLQVILVVPVIIVKYRQDTNGNHLLMYQK
ncbi:uncharacterized protein [Temnothorax nylanderi]|uniref:uncharacterized protein isoform X4 n=1 Tax=Temnothorax nylanderi TaxID=102681 RepID=UPI003A83E6A8